MNQQTSTKCPFSTVLTIVVGLPAFAKSSLRVVPTLIDASDSTVGSPEAAPATSAVVAEPGVKALACAPGEEPERSPDEAVFEMLITENESPIERAPDHV